jgi:hypothetical protein
MVGIINQEIVFTPFAQCVKLQKPISRDMVEMIHVLAK